MGKGERYFRFNGLLQKSGWLSPAYVGVDAAGTTTYLSSTTPQGVATESVLGYALPGFQNAHSHAFQYAMTGSAEVHSEKVDDDFWTWREAMYQCALTVGPDEAEAIAAMVYAEMLRNGYTHVAEFHYLHHDKDGKRYARLAEMGERMIAAAMAAGIKITLIPVFYQRGGFGMEPQLRQRRFISRTVEDFFRLLDESREAVEQYTLASLGFSVHSLRAVELRDIANTVIEGPPGLPFHMHVSEQKKEIEDCAAHCKQRPMQWVLEHLPVDERFNLVHATHLDDTELRDLAASMSRVVLCPSTEGNLGDGIFRMKEYASLKGRWCIGTDSHIGLDPLEEFRMIDYRQRLVTNRRNTFSGPQYMLTESVLQGRAAMGVTSGDHFEVGSPFDAVVYDALSPRLASAKTEELLSVLAYHGNSALALGTIVNGRWVVKNQRHFATDSIRKNFLKAMKGLG